MTEIGNPAVKVGVPVADDGILVVVLLVPKPELRITELELRTGAVILGETNPTVVVFCKLTLDKIAFDLDAIVRVPEVKGKLTKLTSNTDEFRAGLDAPMTVLLSVETILGLLTNIDGTTAVVFNTLLPTSVKKTFVSEAFKTLLVLGNKMVEDANTGVLNDENTERKEELLGSIRLEVGINVVELTSAACVETVVKKGRLVLGKETEEFTNRVTALDKVLEITVESTPTIELSGRLEDVLVLVKSDVNVELNRKLVTTKVLNEAEFVLIIRVTVTVAVAKSTPVEEEGITVRLSAKVVGNVRLPIVPVGENSEDVIVANDDLSNLDVELSKGVLLAVKGNCEIEK